MRRLVAAVLLCLLGACGGDDGGSAPPVPASYAVGGTVSGLSGTGLQLKTGADTLTITADGSFTFPTRLASGASYAVTVSAQPTAPAQTCTVANGTGTVASANITAVAVTCVTSAATYAYAAVVHSAADASRGKIETFAFDPATGQLSLRSAVTTAANTYVDYVKALPSGRQLLVSTSTLVDRASSTIRPDLSLYDLSGVTGVPSLSRLVASPGGGDLLIHPNGTDLYAPDALVRHFSLASGAAQGQSVEIGLQPGLGSAISPDGKFLFVPDSGQDNGFIPFVAVISLADPQKPVLAAKVKTPVRPLTATLSPNGKWLYVTPIDPGDRGLVYRVDTAGGLTRVGDFAVPTYARSAAVTPSGQILYLASGDVGVVRRYRLGDAGEVEPLGDVAVPSAFRLVTGPSGKYLYVLSVPADGSAGAIYGFAIGADGALTAVPGSPVRTGEREYDLTFAAVNP